MGNFKDKKFGKKFAPRGGSAFGGGDRQMFTATCAECGNSCEVPFKPVSGRPVFCSNCFKTRGEGASPERGGGRSFDRPKFGGDKQMFVAVCDKCGNSCEVPFKPMSGKPVYCKACFNSKGPGNSTPSRPAGDQCKAQFELLNNKLDKLIKLLSPATAETPVKEEKAVKVAKTTKKIAKKAIGKKKAK